MKFTKANAFEKLKGILTNDGKKPLRMSERSINETLETLMPLLADEEMELDDFIGKVKPIFETSNSNVEHDVSAGITSGIEDWKKQNAETHDDKKDKKKKDKEHDDDENDERKEILEKVIALENKLKEQEQIKKIDGIKSSLGDALKKKGIKSKEWVDGILSIINIDEEMDVEKKSDELLKLYNKQTSEIDGIETPLTPKGKPSADPFAHFKEEMKRKDEENKNIV